MLGWALSAPGEPAGQADLEKIYHEYKRLMYAVAGKFTRDPEDQKDIVQTAMERLIRIFSAPGAGGRSLSAGYVVFTVRSVSIDLLRRQSREAERRVSVEDDRLEELAAGPGSLEDLLSLWDRRDRLWELWPRLPAEDRVLLEGKYILDLSDEELARILDCKPASIRMKLTRARRRAAALLSERSGT